MPPPPFLLFPFSLSFFHSLALLPFSFHFLLSFSSYLLSLSHRWFFSAPIPRLPGTININIHHRLFHFLTLQLHLHLDDQFLFHHHHFISRFQPFISVISDPSLFSSSFFFSFRCIPPKKKLTQFTHQPVNMPTSQSTSQLAH